MKTCLTTKLLYTGGGEEEREKELDLDDVCHL